MHRSLTTSLGLALLVLLAAPGCNQRATSPPATVGPTFTANPSAALSPSPQLSNDHPPAFHAIIFRDTEHGWAAGDGGILFTSDGGRSWQSQYQGPAYQLGFVSDREGWATGTAQLGDPRARFLTTIDGGVHWRDMGAPGDLRSVSFVTADIGWAISVNAAIGHGSSLIHTTDGGRSWLPITPNAGEWRLQQICFENPETGWAAAGSSASNAGGVLRTVDGGLTWNEVFRQQDWGAGAISCGRITGLWAEMHCCAAAFHDTFVLLRSFDGTDWHPVATNGDPWPSAAPVPGLARAFHLQSAAGASLGAINGHAAFAVGSCGPCQTNGHLLLYLTNDGGITWDFVAPPPLGDGEGVVSFVDRDHGWIASDGGSLTGQIFSTSDGGRSWQLQYGAAH